jgi:superfamily II DNA/RNA helicase
MMRNPEQIQLTSHKDKHSNITQSLLYADDNGHKMRLLDHLLRDAAMDQAIVFTSTKRGADDLADRLSEQGFAAAALHGDMNQRQRTRTLGLLQKGRLRILVATDVAARGIDVQGISHAINYDLPMQAEDYVHRIGRTGRAGRDGLAFTLASHSERHKIRRIEHFIGAPIPANVIEGLEPTKTVRPTYKDRSGSKSFGGPRGGYAGGKPGYGRKPGNDRAPYGDKPSYESRSRFGDSASHEGKPRFGDKPAYEGKPRFGDKPAHEGRSRFGDKAGYEGKSHFGDKPAYEGKSRFGDKPAYEGKSRFGDKHGYEGRPARSERSYGDRPAFADRPAGDRPAFGDRPVRATRPDFSHKGPKPGARPGFAGKPTSTRGKAAARRGDFANS